MLGAVLMIFSYRLKLSFGLDRDRRVSDGERVHDNILCSSCGRSAALTDRCDCDRNHAACETRGQQVSVCFLSQSCSGGLVDLRRRSVDLNQHFCYS